MGKELTHKKKQSDHNTARRKDISITGEIRAKKLRWEGEIGALTK